MHYNEFSTPVKHFTNHLCIYIFKEFNLNYFIFNRTICNRFRFDRKSIYYDGGMT